MSDLDDIVPKPMPRLTDDEALVSGKFVEGFEPKDIAEITGLKKREVEKILERPHVRVSLIACLDEAGATLKKSARVISDAMDATETKFFSFEGTVRDEREIIDHGTRITAAKLNLEARGEIKNGPIISFNRYENMSDEDLAKIALGQQAPELPKQPEI